MDRLAVRYATYSKALPPQATRMKVGGWGGAPLKMQDGSLPQPWHCLPFVEGSTYGLELLYQFETECHVINDNGTVRIEGDFAQEPGGEVTGGEFISGFPKESPKYYIFNTRLDLQPPPGYVLRTEPHPRFYTDDTGTVPLAVVGHVQNEWWPRKLFVLFRSPFPGQRHVFRKGEPYAQVLFVPQHMDYDLAPMSPEDEGRRRALEASIDEARAEIAENAWHSPDGTGFNDHYKILSRAFAREGMAGVEEVVRRAVERHRGALPTDKPIAESLALGHQRLGEGKYDEAKAIYTHVLGRDPGNAEALSHLGISVACTGATLAGLKMMAQAVALEPRSPKYHANLGEMLRMLGRHAEAEAAFRSSLQLNPSDAGVLSALALTLAQQGRTAEGLRACQAALTTGAGVPAVHYRMGLILAQERRHEEARTSFQAALNLDPNFTEARRAIQVLPPARPQ